MGEKSGIRQINGVPVLTPVLLLAAVSVLAPFIGRSVLTVSGLIATAFFSAVFAFARTATGSTLIYLAAIPSLVIGFAVCGSLPEPLYALTYIPVGAVISAVAARGRTRSEAVGISTLILSVCYAVTVAVPLLIDQGSLSLEALKSVYAGPIEVFTSMLRNITVPEGGVEVRYFSDETVEAFINTAFTVSPAIIALFMTALSYIATAFYMLSVKIFRPAANAPVRPWRFRYSKTTAIFFLVCNILALLASAGGGFFQAVSLTLVNFSLIVSYGFIIHGCSVIAHSLRHGENRVKSLIFIVAAVLAAMFNIAIPALMLAFAGVHNAMKKPADPSK